MNLLYNFNTQTGSNNKPSFFEMFLESQMISSLTPAWEYIAAVLAQNNPKYLPLLTYSDEIFYSVVAVLERHYLVHYENFYGLKREIVTKDGKKGPPLQRKHKLWSMFFLVVLPYLKVKADKYYTNHCTEIGTQNNEQQKYEKWQQQLTHCSTKPKLTRIFSKLYPYLSGVYEALFFIYQVLYMYNYTDYFTPFLHLQGLTVQRRTMSDLVRQSRRVGDLKKQRKKIAGSKLMLIWFFMVDTTKLVLDFSQYLLPSAIFFFKFLEWWYHEPRFEKPPEVIPPPPEPPQVAAGGTKIPEDKSLCPLCEEERSNPAMAVSGFVYCYPCLFKYVEKHNKCPITFMPMDVDQIRRLYDSV